MNIHFISNKVEKLFCSEDGKSHIKKIKSLFRDEHLKDCMLQRIQEFINAEFLFDIKKMQNANLHLLKGDRKGELAVDVDTDTNTRGKWRIIFKQINGENVSDDFFNDSKHKTITDIKILEVSEHYK